MKMKQLLISLFLILFITMPLFSYVWEGFERENLWLITAVVDNAVNNIQIVSMNASESNKALTIDLEKTSWSVKGFISREGLFDLSGIEQIQFDIYSDITVNVSIGLSTGKENEWFESPIIKIIKGWNKDLTVSFNNNKWKSEASRWENVINPKNLENVKKISILFFNGEKGKVYLDNIRFTGKEIKNDAYLIPIQDKNTVKMTNLNHLLKLLSPLPANKEFTKEVVIGPENTISLQYQNIDNINKADFQLVRDLNWNQGIGVKLKIINPDENTLFFSMALQTRNGLIWHESPAFILKPIQTNEFYINLRAPYFKTELTQWNYTSFLFYKDEIKAVHFLLYGNKGEKTSGKILVQDFKLELGDAFLPQHEIIPSVYLNTINKTNYKMPDLISLPEFPLAVNQFDKFETSFFITNQYLNPYDPDEIFVQNCF